MKFREDIFLSLTDLKSIPDPLKTGEDAEKIRRLIDFNLINDFLLNDFFKATFESISAGPGDKISASESMDESAPGREIFCCNVCENEYSQSRSLQEHIRVVHQNFKKYDCRFCGKTFNHRSCNIILI